jgi:hypothetical protein
MFVFLYKCLEKTVFAHLPGIASPHNPKNHKKTPHSKIEWFSYVCPEPGLVK